MLVSNDPKMVLVVRRTRLDELITRFNTADQARFYVEHLGADFNDYLAEHETYYEAIRKTVSQLEVLARVQILDRRFLANFIFEGVDAVAVLGQDGLVANALKYVPDQPLMGINPDPSRWEGTLLPFRVEDVSRIATELLADQRKTIGVTMARARLDDGQELLAVNDLFIGRKTHVSATYEMTFGDQSEHQSSSGVLVSTGLGSTGWMRSVLCGAHGILGIGPKRNKARKAGEKMRSRGSARYAHWSNPTLTFAVREPFPGNGLGVNLVYGIVGDDNPLQIVSTMPENGVIFSDGMESDYLSFDSGFKVTIDPSPRQGCLVV